MAGSRCACYIGGFNIFFFDVRKLFGQQQFVAGQRVRQGVQRNVFDNGCQFAQQGHIGGLAQACSELMQRLPHHFGGVLQRLRFIWAGGAVGNAVCRVLNAA